MKDFIKINENDNVIVAIKELAEGEKVTVDGEEYTAAETIPAGHKMAICDIPQGGDVIKYGFRIGNAITSSTEPCTFALARFAIAVAMLFTQPTVGTIQTSLRTPTLPSGRANPIKVRSSVFFSSVFTGS